MEDPLIQALPPATDYLTYLTLLEYQLTPERLPLLHTLLQDEKLTTNIGWDLVKLLLPMLPASTECLQDVARLGNPREVILRVSESLMQLHPEEEDEDEDDKAAHGLPLHILQFNCLLGMLSVLHARIQTKSPSRFVATSLQAALEAYTAMATNETTLAFLEFFREVSPSKRPAPPPRAASESSILRVAAASAPDPEAEVSSPSPSADNETLLVRKFIQFGLLELVKSYLLSFSSPIDPGMSWTIRMQEHLHPDLRLPAAQSQTEAYGSTKELKERDMIMGKIMALSRDVGIDNEELLSIISRSATDQTAQLDFDDPPTNPDQIPLERHGSLLLLAARAAGATLFASGQPLRQVSVFPELAQIFNNFVGGHTNLDEVAFGQPHVLLDSLLALTVYALQQPINPPSNDTQFKDFVVTLTACTARQSHGIVRQIPASIVQSHPSPETRFKLIHKILEDDHLSSARDSAIAWLKDELLRPSQSSDNIFRDPLYFWALFPALFKPVTTASSASNLVASWSCLTQTQGSQLHSALNLYFLLLSSPSLRDQLHLEKTVKYFRGHVLSPLRQLFQSFEGDLNAKGGEGVIEAAVGEEMCQIGNARSVGLIGLTLDQIEETASDAFGSDEGDLGEYSQTEEAKVSEIRKKVDIWQ
ncbi:YAP-binding/Alf4/Glomulin [Penicillium cf. griseofulvum]|uniref:YAP-binding/Alf4/Glomulin n=1 Tax=Penicillium cf. griseofulvum TaxID=2972120 RepID=A0A9W9JTW5_9EURO|nr:YAP-binding/Alf4/Glomulin [Penicillium cf. griseofulvum]KAJ5423427.1 YAP-binding/Alf4/Glomulin [Penicillium cf. griseofulvum]KAJ5431304.1 YAP-binding/Alf4/Glomulin [Penicillium cf. griseofulvum]